MSHKLSLATAALCAALFAIPLVSPQSHATSGRKPKKSQSPTQDQARATPMDQVVFYPFFGDASNLQDHPTPMEKPK